MDHANEHLVGVHVHLLEPAASANQSYSREKTHTTCCDQFDITCVHKQARGEESRYLVIRSGGQIVLFHHTIREWPLVRHHVLQGHRYRRGNCGSKSGGEHCGNSSSVMKTMNLAVRKLSRYQAIRSPTGRRPSYCNKKPRSRTWDSLQPTPSSSPTLQHPQPDVMQSAD